MTFLFPVAIWLTLVVPILIALYVWAQRRGWRAERVVADRGSTG